MTVPDTTRRGGPFDGDDSATEFPFTFKVFEAADIAVVLTDSDGNDTTLTLDSHYSVELNADQEATPGGTVTYPISGDPLAGGEVLTIIGALTVEQPTDLPTGGDYKAQVVEDAMDRIVMLIQQQAEAISRALVTSPSSGGDGLAFPAPSANKFIGWNSAGTALENKTITSSGLDLGADYDWTGTHQFNAGNTADPAILVPTYPTFRIHRTSPAGGSGQVRSPFIIDHKASADTDAFEWGLIVRNSNYADDTAENVGIYGQAYKYHLNGNSFAMVAEAKDLSGDSSIGVLCGLEVDLFGNGSNAASRVGIQTVLGKGNPGGAQFVARAAHEIAPFGLDKSAAKLTNAIDIQANCDNALIRQSNTATAAYAMDFLNGGGVTEFIRFYSGNMPAFQLVGSGGSLGTYVGRLKIDIDDVTYWLPIYG
jgi:hypothetical protein